MATQLGRGVQHSNVNTSLKTDEKKLKEIKYRAAAAENEKLRWCAHFKLNKKKDKRQRKKQTNKAG